MSTASSINYPPQLMFGCARSRSGEPWVIGCGRATPYVALIRRTSATTTTNGLISETVVSSMKTIWISVSPRRRADSCHADPLGPRFILHECCPRSVPRVGTAILSCAVPAKWRSVASVGLGVSTSS